MDSAPYGREVLDTGLRSTLTSLALEAVGTFIVRNLVLNDDIFFYRRLFRILSKGAPKSILNPDPKLVTTS